MKYQKIIFDAIAASRQHAKGTTAPFIIKYIGENMEVKEGYERYVRQTLKK
jgi:hypothetical protein